ncbi:hypothetical protein EJB05_35222, partial [Eragrostis curvula]
MYQPNEDVEDEYVGSVSDTLTPCDVETVDSSSSGNEVSEDDESGDGGSEDGEANNNQPVRNYRKKTVNVHSLINGSTK